MHGSLNTRSGHVVPAVGAKSHTASSQGAGFRSTLACLALSLLVGTNDAQITIRPGSAAEAREIARPPAAEPLQTLIHPAAFDAVKLCGQVGVDTLRRYVRIDWSYAGPDGARAFFAERIDLDYWPTAAARVNDARRHEGSSFVVAGKRPESGKTVIERWEPSFTALPADGAPTIFTRTVIYEADTPGRRVVRMATPLNELAPDVTPGRVLLQFDDSGDLYTLNAADGVLNLTYSAASEPELTQRAYSRIGGGMLRSGVSAYLYTCDYHAYSEGALLFEDHDHDGWIDNVVTYSHAQVLDGTLDALEWRSKYDS